MWVGNIPPKGGEGRPSRQPAISFSFFSVLSSRCLVSPFRSYSFHQYPSPSSAMPLVGDRPPCPRLSSFPFRRHRPRLRSPREKKGNKRRKTSSKKKKKQIRRPPSPLHPPPATLSINAFPCAVPMVSWECICTSWGLYKHDVVRCGENNNNNYDARCRKKQKQKPDWGKGRSRKRKPGKMSSISIQLAGATGLMQKRVLNPFLSSFFSSIFFFAAALASRRSGSGGSGGSGLSRSAGVARAAVGAVAACNKKRGQ